MDIKIKITYYSIIMRVLFLIAVLSAMLSLITDSMSKGTVSLGGLIFKVLFHPCFLIAAILFWRILENKKLLKEKKDQSQTPDNKVIIED